MKALEEKIEERQKVDENVPIATGTSTSTVRDIADLGLREIANRENRKPNIMIFNVKECVHDDKETIKTHDLEDRESSTINRVAVEIKHAFRLCPNGNKCRPLKVVLGSEEQQKKALKTSTN